MGLGEYHRKRDFTRTAEPRGRKGKSAGRSYVIQKHAASRLHYDFRLEHAGALLSWAVPKGPSLDPADKRLAVRVEDHPLEYGTFEGVIPKGEYGGGSVLVWDRGKWIPAGDVDDGLRRGKLEFELDGKKLSGAWRLIRLKSREESSDKNWLLVKRHDASAAAASRSITETRPESVLSGKAIEDIGTSTRTRSRSGDREPNPRSKRSKSNSKGTGAERRKPTPAKLVARTIETRPSAKRRKPTTAKLVSRASQTHPSPARTRPNLAKRIAKLPNARRARLPGFVPVQLATLVEKAPDGPDWIHEIKYDGYRMQAELNEGRVRWFSRNGLDWTGKIAVLSPAIAALGARTALLDGEVVVLDDKGISHFQGLQQVLGDKAAEGLTYFAFDLLYLDGYDLRECALVERKQLLEALLARVPGASGVSFSEHFESRGPAFLESACTHELEGIVSKRRDSAYHSGRSREWTKAKCGHRQEFVVVGFTEPHGSRTGLGALVLAVNDNHGRRFAGRVGTGFDRDVLARLRERLEPLRIAKPAVIETLSAADSRGVRWVKPELVVEVAFTGWTADGRLRHPTFEGIREDKRARDVVRERARQVKARTRTPRSYRTAGRGTSSSDAKNPSVPRSRRPAKATPQPRRSAKAAPRTKRPAPASSTSPATRAASRAGRAASANDNSDAHVAGVRISHPDRVLDSSTGVTKLDVARYYARAGSLLLPHIIDRPLSVVRCTHSFSEACFVQKHAGGSFPASVKSIALKDSHGKSEYLAVDTLEGLVSLVQMNVIEVHPWGSRADRLEVPDRMFFDLDPAPDVAWKRVVEAALLVRDALRRMDVESFVKTTGGKGLHLVVPLARKYSWDAVKSFSRALAFELARTAPKQFVANAKKSERAGRIFVDYLRNARGATAVAPYSVRARSGSTVSLPVAWKDLESLSSSAPFHLEHGAEWKPPAGRDPWAAFARSEQVLPRLATLKQNARH